ncbi:MAG: (2Fe-2S)-binding protein [Pseudomonadota bacterium]
MITLKVNGEVHQLDVDPNMPLLWALRENLQLTGTKFGCGMAQCGACTVHLNGQAIRSCVTPISVATSGEITTIEAIGAEGDLHPVQEAWIDHQVPQCGYCQSGQIMSAVALLDNNPNPDEAAIDQAMAGNICRCGMYGRIKKAIQSVGVQSFDPAQEVQDA